jgi:hypothetical protein
MKTKGSKSAPTKRAKSPAKGGKPEVTLESGTVAVLPNPAGAPAPKTGKGGRKGKAASTKSDSPATAALVPEWAQRAAARNTPAEMAAVPPVETAAEPTPEAPAATKGRAPKAKAAPTPTKNATETPAAAPGSLRAIADAWLASLQDAGHTPSTVSSYRNDMEVAHEFFGDISAGDMTEKQVATFNASKAVVKKANGKPKAQPTILKTRRALRLALVWAEEQGLIKKAPIPAA